MLKALYRAGFSLMKNPPLPGGITVGASIVRLARELDTDEDRQLRAWDKAHGIIQAWKRKEIGRAHV